MRRKLGFLCILLGVLYLLMAFALVLDNRWKAENARQQSEKVMIQLEQVMENTVPPENTEEREKPSPPEIREESTGAQTPKPEQAEMITVEMDGNSYIGFLRIPTLKLELPVMADWSDSKLQIAPCRYHGSIKEENLVVTAHNYSHHFGSIHQLQPGDAVEFVDVQSDPASYQVVMVEVILPTEIEKVTESGFDLTLLTCTYGGGSRVVVYCDLCA